MKIKKIFISIIVISMFLITSFSGRNYITIEAEEPKEERQLKAVWMSTFVGEAPYSNEAQFKSHMNSAFDAFEYYGINALIFHVRTHNNAFYPSELNPLASWWNSVNFDVFDPVAWIIEESHKRGIEFHAWMNPYRVDTARQVGSAPLGNPQNDPDNLIVNKSSVILNPAKEVVREHIYDTIIEFTERYPNVDAIHFDDYFYIENSEEPTTSNGRREEINKLIEGIHNALSIFNEENDTAIQFGISPTGIYKNGNGIVRYDEDGNPITTGSSTSGFQHYGEYLYADTVKWATEGWIDYLMPQIYWARDLHYASFTKLTDWWDKVFKYLDVNLYAGIGVYMADRDPNIYNTYGWQKNLYEMDEQLKLLDRKENISGYSIYSYKHLRNGYINSNLTSGKQIRNAYEEDSRRQVKIIPLIKSMKPVVVPSVTNINKEDDSLTWNSVLGGKFYYVYYSEEELSYSTDEIIGVVGHTDGKMTYDITGYEDGEFGVRAISQTNHLSPLLKENEISVTFDENHRLGSLETVIINKGDKVLAPKDPFKEEYTFLGWYIDDVLFDFNEPIDTNIVLKAKWTVTIYYVDIIFHQGYDNISEVVTIEEGTMLEVPIDPTRAGYTFKGWYYNNEKFLFDEPILEDILLIAQWERNFINITVDYNYDDLTEIIEIFEGTKLYQLRDPIRLGYTFLGWYKDDVLFNFDDLIYNDIVLKAKWEKVVEVETVNVLFDLGYDNLTLPLKTIEKGSKVIRPTDPIRDGFIFTGWTLGSDKFDFNSSVLYSITLKANWKEINTEGEVNVTFKNGEEKEIIKIPSGNSVTEPYTPHKENYIFLGWHLNDELYSFDEIINKDIELVAKWDILENLENVSIYNNTHIRDALFKVKEGLVYYGVINLEKEIKEHGFYLIYGRTTYLELKDKINDDDIYINDKIVFKVPVRGTDELGIYSVVLTGIPSYGYSDDITVAPYITTNDGTIVLSKVFKVSSFNHAKTFDNVVIKDFKMYCLIEDLNRKNKIVV